MKEINTDLIVKSIEKLCAKSNYELPDDIYHKLIKSKTNEKFTLPNEVLDIIINNAILAKEKKIPICQDTGMAIVYVEFGQNIKLIGNLSLEEAINKGVAQGYLKNYLRCSVIEDPIFNRVNTNNNTPAIIYTTIVKGNNLKITLAPKGFGSENMTQLKMFNPSTPKSEIVDFIIDVCKQAGSKPCPPIIVGIGIGGTSCKAVFLAKKALLRTSRNKNILYAKLETEILQKINNLNIGPQGLGGNTTALDVYIETFATHIAGLPCAVNIGCHVTRHSTIEL